MHGCQEVKQVEMLRGFDIVYCFSTGVSLVRDFLKRKVQELNGHGKSGGKKKKKGGAAPAASLPTHQPSGGINAAAVVLVSAAGDDAWNKIPTMKAGAAGKKKKGHQAGWRDAGLHKQVGHCSLAVWLVIKAKLYIALLQSDDL